MLARILASTLIVFGNLCCQASAATAQTTALPKANFTAVPAAPFVNQIVKFSNTSSGNPSAWLWSFGDGSSSTVKAPSHSYTAAGSFKVSLKATNAKGSNSISKTLTVAVPPKGEFSCTPAEIAVGQAVTCKDLSTAKATSWAWSFGDGGTSSVQNPTHTYSKAGNFTVMLKVNLAGIGYTVNHNVKVNATVAQPGFNLSQTLSDGAQRTTLAFSGLAMMTGNLAAQSFFPPGKVADYTGFQYLRDNDPDNMGHNTSFLTRVANNVIYTLNDEQFAQLKALAVSQLDQINLYGYKRFPLMKAFRRVLSEDIPMGSSGLNLNAVKKASRELYLLDGQISFDRALLYANILNSMTTSQKAYLTAMKGKGWKSWPDIGNADIQSKMQGLPQGTAVAVMTYASDLFSWFAGSIEADVYFCPERHGTYYGSFYIKDAPAIGHEGYGIDEQLTATAGAALSDSSKGYVTPGQAQVMSSLVDSQRDNLYASTTSNIVKVRTEIATLLRSLLTSTATAVSVKSQVLALSASYGELDGANNYAYANVFADVYQSLSDYQKSQLGLLRQSIMSGVYADGTRFDYSLTTTPFLYSQVIKDSSVLSPYTGNTDYLFFEPAE